MKTVMFVLFWLILCSTTYSQDQFMVMSIKGKVEFSSGSGRWSPVSVGLNLGPKDVVRTSYASYVKLMLNAQRLVSVDENTTRVLQDLAKKGLSSGPVSSKIFQFSVAKLQRTKRGDGESTIGASRLKNDSSQLSSVVKESGLKDVIKTDDKTIAGQLLGQAADQLLVPKREQQSPSPVKVSGMKFRTAFPLQTLATTSPTFEWVDAGGYSEYELVIMNDLYEPLASKRTPARSFTYDNSDQLLGVGKTYNWQVKRISDGRTSDIQRFTILAQDSMRIIQEDLRNLKKELSSMDADDITASIMRGMYLEKRSLFTEAVQEYRQAVRFAPEIPEYHDLVLALLQHLGLSNEADYLIR